MQPLSIGISGFGGTGSHQAAAFDALPACRVTGVYDPKPAGRQRAAAALPGVFTTDNLDALLDSGIDIFAVCSPFHFHAEQVIRALEAGKHVLCEQPLSGSIEDCRRIVQAASKHARCHVGVQRVMRHVRIHEAMHRLTREGRLGTLSYAEGHSVQDAKKRLGKHDTWAMETAPSPMLLAGCHIVDLLRWLTGDEIEQATGMGNNRAFPEYRNDDLCVALLRFRSGLIGKVVASFAAARPQDHSIRIIGSERSIDNNLLLEKDGRYELLGSPLVRHRHDPRHSLKKRIGAALRDVRQNFKCYAAHKFFELGGRIYRRGGATYPVSAYPLRLYEHNLAIKTSVEAFAELVRSGRAPSCFDVIDASKSIAACLAAVEACRTSATTVVANVGSIDDNHDGDGHAARPGARSKSPVGAG